MTDIVGEIDGALADDRAAGLQLDQCATCRRRLDGDASYYWCSDNCQGEWHAARTADDGGHAAEVPEWSPEAWSPQERAGASVRREMPAEVEFPARWLLGPEQPCSQLSGTRIAASTLVDICAGDREFVTALNRLHDHVTELATRQGASLRYPMQGDRQLTPEGVRIFVSAEVESNPAGQQASS